MLIIHLSETIILKAKMSDCISGIFLSPLVIRPKILTALIFGNFVGKVGQVGQVGQLGHPLVFSSKILLSLIINKL